MQKNWFLYVVLLLIATLFFTKGGIVFAQTPTPTPSSNYETEKLKQIEELQHKINELQSEGKTLSSQIEIMESQIAITELRIEETNEKIKELGVDIGYTEKYVDDLQQEIIDSTKLLLQRMNSVQKVGRFEPWQVFLTSTNINNFFTRLTYLKIVQLNDHKRVYAAEQAKVNYENQKSILEEKQEEQEALNSKLENYTSQLEADKQAKDQLLEQTKSSEKEYQKQLSAAMAELRQIQNAAKILVSEEPKDVKRGDPIGLMGSTGFSTGPHLHFGVYNLTSLSDYNYNSGHENPINVLENQSVDWGTGCSSDPSGSTPTGNGNFLWPMSTDNLYLSQGYGQTCWSWMYATNVHPALDMVNNSNIVVRAADDGKAYICRNCTGDGANGVFLFHKNGKMTLYWHLQ